MKKLFGGLNLTWPKVILFAVLAGVYTGIMAMIPVTENTSFRDISISFEWWILFGIVIIVNCKTPVESALKTFVFFLISQPLVYLVQVPFSEMGFGLFQYYKPWFIWTLFTIPMAFIGNFMKSDKWWGMLILGPMMLFLGGHYAGFFREAVSFFPQHLLSALFCAVTLVIYPLYIFHDRKIRLAGLILAVLIIVAGGIFGIADRKNNVYETHIMTSDGDTAGVAFDDTFKAYFEDPEFGEATIVYEENLDCYMLHCAFRKTGDVVLILESPEGQRYEYDMTVERNTYQIKRRE